MRYHLFKQTRLYHGEPYCGPTSDYEPAEYDDLFFARVAAVAFQDKNPVGWNIYDSELHELVDGFDYHTEAL